jgi:acyl dehydratase
MPLDPDVAMAAPQSDFADSWQADRVLLYHVGLGAGARATDPAELAYVNERHLKVLPTFGVIPGFEAVRPAMLGPGLDYKLSKLLHGEQDLVVHNPLPPEASVITRPAVEAVYDKGKAGLLVLRGQTRASDGTPLFTNRFRLFIRGEGGFGGDSGPAPEPWEVSGEPALLAEVPTLPQQAAIYRLSGDRNPLHIDPAFAARAGFDRPILHGLCTYGMVCKALVDGLLDGDTAAVGGWSARFAGSVYPGETLVVSAWKDDDRFLVRAEVAGRDAVALSNGVLRLR